MDPRLMATAAARRLILDACGGVWPATLPDLEGAAIALRFRVARCAIPQPACDPEERLLLIPARLDGQRAYAALLHELAEGLLLGPGAEIGTGVPDCRHVAARNLERWALRRMPVPEAWGYVRVDPERAPLGRPGRDPLLRRKRRELVAIAWAAGVRLDPRRVTCEVSCGRSVADRPALAHLLGLVEAGLVTHLVVWHPCRLSPDAGLRSDLMRRLHCAKVRVIWNPWGFR